VDKISEVQCTARQASTPIDVHPETPATPVSDLGLNAIGKGWYCQMQVFGNGGFMQK
jgi:hypothetical protein